MNTNSTKGRIYTAALSEAQRSAVAAFKGGDFAVEKSFRTSNEATATPTSSATATTPPTNTATAVATSTATPTAPAFRDVAPGDYFYAGVTYLSSRGILSSYADGTFRPYANTTRSQLVKIVVLAEGWTVVEPATPTFRDVPSDNPFYGVIETAYDHEIIGGYADQTFRPGNNTTRGQIAKIVHLAVTAP